MMNTRIKGKQSICSITVATFFAGCTSVTPPALSPGNSADAQVRVPENRPNNLLAHDEATVAIQTELSQQTGKAKATESTQQMGQGDMPGMQHGDMKMEGEKDMPTATDVMSEKKAVADEMKKTSDEMKKASEEMKKESTPPK